MNAMRLYNKVVNAMSIGRKAVVLKDISRIDPISKSTREILISIYYPSEPLDNKPKYTTLFEPCVPLAVDMLCNMGVNREYISNLETGVFNNARINMTTKNCPILFISPAFGVVRDMYSFCVEHLVKNGFVVITIGASHESIFSTFPDGRFIQQSQEISEIDSVDIKYWKELLELRVEDIRYVLSNVEEALDSVRGLRTIVDINTMGIMGHSLGGAAAYEVLKGDKRVKACIMLDPSFHLITVNTDERGSAPLLVVRQEKCTSEELGNEVSQELLPLLLKGFNNLHKSSPVNSAFIKLHGADHMTFSDIPIHYEDNGIELKHSIINMYICAFFDEHLKKKEYVFHELMTTKPNDGIDEINSNGMRFR